MSLRLRETFCREHAHSKVQNFSLFFIMDDQNYYVRSFFLNNCQLLEKSDGLNFGKIRTQDMYKRVGPNFQFL